MTKRSRLFSCRSVPQGVLMPASLDGLCPACGEPISEHSGVSTVLDNIAVLIERGRAEEADRDL